MNALQPIHDLRSALSGIDGIGEFELLRLYTAQALFMPALQHSGCITRDMVALEIGCGRALKSVAFSKLFDEYHGVELVDKELEVAERVLKATGSKVQLHSANGIEVARNPQRFGLSRRPDFLVLYAVLEHLLPEERTEVLGLVREIIEDGGAVFIAETPNRLIPFDAHSTFLHFVQSLEPRLAARYTLKNSPHKELVGKLKAMGGGVDDFFRCGAGLSYHDFELDVIGSQTSEMPFAFTGWSHHLLKNQPLQSDEEWLLNYFKDNTLLVHPAFSRVWIEGLISKRAPFHHQSTVIGKPVNFGGYVERSGAFYGHDHHRVTKDTPLTLAFDNTVGDMFELVVHARRTSSLASLKIETGAGIFVAGHDWEHEIGWHDATAIAIKIVGPVQSVILSTDGDEPIFVRAVIENGFCRNGSSLATDRAGS